MSIYPPAPPTVSGDLTTINRFLSSPAAVTQRLRELTMQRFIADFLLAERTPAPSGTIQVESFEPLYLATDPRPVNPGSEYPRGSETRPTTTLASVTKWGQELPLTDEAISRYRTNSVDRVLRKLANNTVRTVDTTTLAVVAAAVTQTQAAVASWATTATARPFLDIMLAKAVIDTRDEGFVADTVVLTPILFARLADLVTNILPREGGDGVVATGNIPEFAGLTFVTSTRLPVSSQPLVCDRQLLGGMAFEDVASPEWDGSSATGPEVRVRRDPTGNDQWLLGSRRVVVPYVVEPGAGVFITGA